MRFRLPKNWVRFESLRLLCALIGIGFILGAAAGSWVIGTSSYKSVREAVASVHVNLLAPRLNEPWEREYYYYATRYPGEGVIQHETGHAYAGYTLFSASDSPAAYLVDMQGQRLHEWRLPFSAVWSKPPHIDMPVPDSYVVFRRTHVFPNGDLLAIYEAPGHWPYAYGLVKLDKYSNLIWAHADFVNHDLEVAADGRIYTLLHRVRTRSEPGLEGLRAPVAIDDQLLVLTPDGRELERISIIDAFAASAYAPLLNETGDKDVLHTNSLQLVTREIARSFPFAEPGQVLLSHNFRGALSLIDPETKRIVWARRVSYKNQHSARFLPDGTIGMFQNADNFAVGGGSRVVMLDPTSGAERWVFAGSKEFRFYSDNRGSVQPLPNGNVLVTESNAGRIFEVTRSRDVVWEFRIGHTMHGKTPAVFDALRIDPATLNFLPSATQANRQSKGSSDAN